MADTSEIERKIDRVEQIIDTLETEDVDLAEAKRLRDEGMDLLDALRDELAVGDGTVEELEG